MQWRYTNNMDKVNHSMKIKINLIMKMLRKEPIIAVEIGVIGNKLL